MNEIEVDHEANLAAVAREAEMWRTAKDRLAEKLADTETENARLNARVDHVERSLYRESQRVIHAEEALAAECAQHRADYEAALEVTVERDQWRGKYNALAYRYGVASDLPEGMDDE